jgi:hypothetical protein
VVDVTSDHSLITECGRVVKPSECSVGVSMHADLPSMKDSVFKWLFESPLSYVACITRNPVRRIGDYLVSLLGYEYILEYTRQDQKKIYARPVFSETRHKVLFGEFGVHDSGIVRSRGNS